MTPEQQKKFKYWQWRTLLGTIVGYVFFYIVRKNFSFAMPGLTAEYGIDKATLGAILTLAGFLYGLSKLVNGILADRVNGRWHMVIGLAVCSITSILFGLGASIASTITGVSDGEKFVSVLVVVLSVLWIVNNIFQGCGFPPCSRLIPRWVPASELATKMSIWNTSHSIGAAIAGILCGVIIMGHMGTNHSNEKEWVDRVGNNLSKKITKEITVSVAELRQISGDTVVVEQKNLVDNWYDNAIGSDELFSKAYTTVETNLSKAENKADSTKYADLLAKLDKDKKFREKKLKPEQVTEIKEQIVSKSQHVGAWKWSFLIPGIIALIGVFITAIMLRDTPKSVGLPELQEGNEKKQEEKTETSAELSAFIRKHVWKNPVIWALAVADFFVYVIRFAVLDWGPTFLQESRGLTPAQAGWTVVIFEIFGVIGMFAAGVISDKLFKGRAARTCLFCMLGALIFIVLFCVLPANTDPMLLLFVLAFAGMFIYGPQALIGVISSNHATRKGSATALGIIGFVSYISVLVSGWGFGLIADSKFGWEGVFVAMIVMAVIGAAIFIPMWKMKRDAYGEEE